MSLTYAPCSEPLHLAAVLDFVGLEVHGQQRHPRDFLHGAARGNCSGPTGPENLGLLGPSTLGYVVVQARCVCSLIGEGLASVGGAGFGFILFITLTCNFPGMV